MTDDALAPRPTVTHYLSRMLGAGVGFAIGAAIVGLVISLFDEDRPAWDTTRVLIIAAVGVAFGAFDAWRTTRRPRATATE